LRPKLWIGGDDGALVCTSRVTSDIEVLRIVLSHGALCDPVHTDSKHHAGF